MGAVELSVARERRDLSDVRKTIFVVCLDFVFLVSELFCYFLLL